MAGKRTRMVKLNQTGYGIGGVLRAYNVLRELMKLRFKQTMEGDDGHEISVSTFSTCRTEGFLIRNYGNNKAVAFSESAGSDDIRVLVGRTGDFYQTKERGPKTHGYHDYSGPDNEWMWEAAKSFGPEAYKSAARYIRSQLNSPRLPYRIGKPKTKKGGK